MDLGLKGKVAVVTGASRGIGLSIALELADEGCNLAICSRGEEALQKVAQALRDKGPVAPQESDAAAKKTL